MSVLPPNTSPRPIHAGLLLTTSSLNTRLEKVDLDLVELSNNFIKVDQKVETLEVSIRNGFTETNNKLHKLKKEVAEVKADVAEVKADVAEVKVDVAEVKGNITALNAKMEKVLAVLQQTSQHPITHSDTSSDIKDSYEDTLPAYA